MPNHHAQPIPPLSELHTPSILPPTQTSPLSALLIVNMSGDIVWANPQTIQWFKLATTVQETLQQAVVKNSNVEIRLGDIKTLAKHGLQQTVPLELTNNERCDVQITFDLITHQGDSQLEWALCSLTKLSGSLKNELALQHPIQRLRDTQADMAKFTHELNNTLDSTIRYLHLTQAVLEQNRLDKAKEYLQQGLQGLQRMTMVASNMGVVHQDSTTQRPRLQSLRSLLQEITDTINAENSMASIDLHYKIQSNLPCIDTNTLYQVCCNIIKNAVDAMNQGGTLTITGQLNTKDHLTLSFHDSGPGISLDQMPYIFDPFYTTRPQGTGLGLTICRDLLRKIKGTIQVTPVSSGACICIEVPLQEIT